MSTLSQSRREFLKGTLLLSAGAVGTSSCGPASRVVEASSFMPRVMLGGDSITMSIQFMVMSNLFGTTEVWPNSYFNLGRSETLARVLSGGCEFFSPDLLTYFDVLYLSGMGIHDTYSHDEFGAEIDPLSAERYEEVWRGIIETIQAINPRATTIVATVGIATIAPATADNAGKSHVTTNLRGVEGCC